MQTVNYYLSIMYHDSGGNFISGWGPQLFNTKEGVQEFINQARGMCSKSRFFVAEEIKSSSTRNITGEFVC